jgi:hypothetical protein
MGDNDFPAVGFLREYLKGKEYYRQAGPNIPSFSLQDQYAQESGGPLVGQQLISSTPSFEINESPSIDPDIYLPGLTKRINYAKRQLGLPERWTEDQVRQYSKIKGV